MTSKDAPTDLLRRGTVKRMFSPSRGLDSFDQYLLDVENTPHPKPLGGGELWPAEPEQGTRKPPSVW